MTAKVIDGRKIAKDIRLNIKSEIDKIKLKGGIVPSITTIKVGNDPSSEIYLRLRNKACEEVGIISNVLELDEKVSEADVLKKIDQLNNDPKIHGILIQFPVPDHIKQDRLINALNPKKDVEGLNPYNMGRTLIGDESIIPCTPYSVLSILESENIIFKGSDVVILNHSNLVGKPLAALLLNRNATVSVCHVFSKDWTLYSTKADIFITATGVPRLIKPEHIKKDCFVVDVGIISTKDGICGDVDFESVKNKAGKLTPVPGGVGPVTVACALKNMLKTYRNCIKSK